MSDAEREHMEEIIDDRLQVLISAMFWRLVRWVGLPGIVGVLALAAGWSTLMNHVKDGHPATVKAIVVDVQKSLVRIETNQENIVDDIGEIKKKLDELD
jgi:hypothetical protein